VRLGLATCLLFLVACGDREADRDITAVLDVLDARAGVLSPDLHVEWMRTGLRPLRDGLRSIEGGGGIRVLGADEAAQRIRSARVVLVADLHDLDPCRRAFASAVRQLSSPSARAEGRVAIALESVPLTMESQVRWARSQEVRDGVDPLAGVLRAAWTWPVLETAALLRDEDLSGCPLLAVGRTPHAVFPPPDTPDAERRPGLDLSGGMSVADWKYGNDFARANWNTLGNVTQWMRAMPDRQCFVLYGAAHLLGEGNLVDRFQKAGLDVIVLVPFLPEWEAALRRRFGSAAASTWYEVAPRVLRPPYVADREIVALGRRSESRTSIRLPEPAKPGG